MSKSERADVSRTFFSQESDDEIVYACDAAGARLIEGEKTCGLAVVIYSPDGEPLKIWKRKVTDPNATSIMGELMAMYDALQIIDRHADMLEPTQRITLFTDNQFACQIANVQMVTKLPHLVDLCNNITAITHRLALRGVLRVRMVHGKLNIDADAASREVIKT